MAANHQYGRMYQHKPVCQFRKSKTPVSNCQNNQAQDCRQDLKKPCKAVTGIYSRPNQHKGENKHPQEKRFIIGCYGCFSHDYFQSSVFRPLILLKYSVLLVTSAAGPLRYEQLIALYASKGKQSSVSNENIIEIQAVVF
jgi:hypothetical protein